MIPTAEEFMKNQGLSVKQLQNLPWFDYGNLLTWIEEYSIIKAKFHVQAALSNVDILASLKCNDGKGFRDFIDEYLIIDAYPLTLIK